MNALLDAQPLWQGRSWHAAHDSGLDPGMPLGSTPPIFWPTPPATVWDDIQMIAARALVTLDWLTSDEPNAQSKRQVAGHEHADDKRLQWLLLDVIVTVIIGHMLDIALNLSDVLVHGLIPILRQCYTVDAVFPSLVYVSSAMLQRIAMGDRLIDSKTAASNPGRFD